MEDKRFEWREDPHYWLGYFSNMLETEIAKHPKSTYYKEALEEWKKFHPRMLAAVKRKAVEDYKIWGKTF